MVARKASFLLPLNTLRMSLAIAFTASRDKVSVFVTALIIVTAIVVVTALAVAVLLIKPPT